MIWRNDRQLAQVCELLCRLAGKRGMWSIEKCEATPECVDLIENGCPWSHGELLLFQTAWALWNGRTSPNFGELVSTLDGKRLSALGGLLTAMSDPTYKHLDEWIVTWSSVLNLRWPEAAQ